MPLSKKGKVNRSKSAKAPTNAKKRTLVEPTKMHASGARPLPPFAKTRRAPVRGKRAKANGKSATPPWKRPASITADSKSKVHSSSAETKKGATAAEKASDKSRSRASPVAATLRPSPASLNKHTPDILAVTVNEHETKALLAAFENATGHAAVPEDIDGRVYRHLGSINGTTVVHALSEMGSAGRGATQQTVDKAIRAVHPRAVIGVGIAFGIDEDKQTIGDILLSTHLRLYDLQRVGAEIVLRGDKPHASTRLINFFLGAAQTSWRGATVRPAIILTGDKLVDNIDYRHQLVAFEAEAIGGEMEGAGLYVSSEEHKVDWIIIKAICDWGDGHKFKNKKHRQKKAATIAAEFLLHALQGHPFPADSTRPPIGEVENGSRARIGTTIDATYHAPSPQVHWNTQRELLLQMEKVVEYEAPHLHSRLIIARTAAETALQRAIEGNRPADTVETPLCRCSQPAAAHAPGSNSSIPLAG